MKKTLFKLNKRIMTQGASLIAVFAVLVVTLVAYLPNLTLGWFSENTTVTANGMGVKAYETPLVVYYRVIKLGGADVKAADGTTLLSATDEGWIEIDLGGSLPIGDHIQMPGDSVDFQLKILNTGVETVSLTAFGLAAPAGAVEESPRTDANGVEHYLSTELYTSLEGISDTDCSLNATRPDMYLRSGDTAGAIDYFSQMTGTPDIASGENVILTAKFSFIDRTTDQNIFKNFGDYGACQRRLFFLFENN